MMALDLLVGSGGVLSHAPRRVQAALMLMDSFEPQFEIVEPKRGMYRMEPGASSGAHEPV